MADDITHYDAIEGYCERLSCLPGDAIGLCVSSETERFDVKVSHRRSHDCSTSWRSRTSLAALSIPSRTRP